MVKKRLVRRLSVYFSNETAQTFVLEAADTLRDLGNHVLRLDRWREGGDIITFLNLSEVSYCTLQSFTVEEQDGPQIVREPRAEPGELI